MTTAPIPESPGLDSTKADTLYFDTIGCRLNQSEIELMARQARAAGLRLVESAAEADWVVLNSCTVTAGADSETRHRIKQAHKSNPEAAIVVTGCWATLHADSARRLPGVQRVVPNKDKAELIPALFNLDRTAFDLEPVERKPIPGIRMRTRAFIKAQDGCDHGCAYCLTTVARGPARSLPVERIIRQVQAAVDGGAKEAVLSGVQLSSYGRDLAGSESLTSLVRAVLHDTAIERVRLSSLEPWGLPKDFFQLWQDARVCRQLHLPLQSGSRPTLRRMRRPMTPQRFRQLVNRARQAIPGIAITTDILTGFPGESETEFKESLDFIRQMEFSDAHVFPFSARPNTPAAAMQDQIPSRIAKERAAEIRSVIERSRRRFQRQFLGTVADVLWESAESLGPQGWRMGGLTDNYLRVKATTSQDRWNELSPVQLQSSLNGYLQGVVLSD